MSVDKKFVLVTMVVTVFLFSGCQGEKPVSDGKAGDTNTPTVTSGDHSGWWCKEHAIPEEVCSMCSASAAKDFKEKGDWCEEHNRAKSQCFKCDPTQAEKYAKRYEAKYGKAPPAAIDQVDPRLSMSRGNTLKALFRNIVCG